MKLLKVFFLNIDCFEKYLKKYFLGTGNTCAATNNPCKNNAPCVVIPGGGIRCVCPAGFTGVYCDYATGRVLQIIIALKKLLY